MKSHVRGKFDGEEVYADSGHSVQPYVGVGGWYAFNPNFRMELGIDFTRSKIDDAKANLRLISLGARFSF